MEDTLANPFRHIPPTASGHFRLSSYAAIFCLANHVRRMSELHGGTLEDAFGEFPFLQGYLGEMLPYLGDEVRWDQARAWWRQALAAWEEACTVHLPLRALRTLEGIDYDAVLALLCVGLVEEDSRFGTLVAQLQAPLSYRRPSLELVSQILRTTEAGGGRDGWHTCRPLVTSGLIQVVNRDAPRSEWVLRVPSMLWDAVRGDLIAEPAAWCRLHRAAGFPMIPELIFAEDFLEQLAQVPSLLQDGKAEALVLRGSPGSDRFRVAGTLARTMGRHVVAVDATEEGDQPSWAGLGPYCTLAHALPVITYDLGPGETVTLPDLPGYHGPLGVLLDLEGGLRGKLAESALTLNLPLLRYQDRERCWQAAFADHEVTDLAAISERFHLPGDYIRQAASMAIAHSTLNRRDVPRLDDVQVACRMLNRQMLDTLATRLETKGSWDQLVSSEMMAAKLGELEQRCRHRERLLGHLAPAFVSSQNRGVRALFSGASGTGKTLAAKILAAELGIDLYRVDLAAVVNKYIGETEKNLHRVLSRAEELDVILLLDEGDALLGNRTEVKSANDRYANLETNYLLQRLETYQGIVVVTTNAGENIDKAFQRRMDVVVNFIAPQAVERWLIWQLHLPAGHAVNSRFLQEVAVRCALTGGQIRNAALHATLIALEDGSTVRRWHLEQAIHSEYRKAGAVCPMNGRDRADQQRERVDTLLTLMPY